MVDLVVLQSVSYVAAAMGVLVAAIYYVFTLRINQRNIKHTLETRQAQLFMQLYDKLTETKQWDEYTEIMERWSWTDFSNFMRKYGPEENPEEWNKFYLCLGQWERVGLLVRDGLIDPKLVWHWLGSIPVRLGEKYEPVLDEYREKYEAPPPRACFSNGSRTSNTPSGMNEKRI